VIRAAALRRWLANENGPVFPPGRLFRQVWEIS
jgi:hypothetical protein